MFVSNNLQMIYILAAGSIQSYLKAHHDVVEREVVGRPVGGGGGGGGGTLQQGFQALGRTHLMRQFMHDSSPYLM